MKIRFLSGMVLLLALLAGACSPLLADAGPSFQILQPVAEQVITGTKIPLAIAFQSADSAPVVRFDAYVDSTWLIGGRVRNPIPVGSFRVDADLTDVHVSSGNHTLYIKLFDSQGNVTQHEVKITLQTPTVTMREVHSKPKVTITNPKNGDVISRKTNIHVEASADAEIKWVTVYINGIFHAMTNEAPYLMAWDPIHDGLLAGPCTISARALDLFNNEGISVPVIVSVQPPNNGPTSLNDQFLDISKHETTTLNGFPFAMLLVPTNGIDTARRVTASLLAPLGVPGSFDSAMPDLLPGLPRLFQTPTAGGALLALLPPKQCPGAAEMARIEATGTLPMTSAPALAAGPVAPLLLAGDTLSPQRGALLLPPPLPLAPRNGLPDEQPVLIALLPIFDKDQPAIAPQYLGSRQAPVAATLKGPRDGASVQRMAVSAAGVLPAKTPAAHVASIPREQVSNVPADRAPATPRLIAQIPDAMSLPSTMSDSAPSALPAAGDAETIIGPADRHSRARVTVLGPPAIAGMHTRVLLDETGKTTCRTLSAAQPAIAASTPMFKKHSPASVTPMELAAITTTATHPVLPTRGDPQKRVVQLDPLYGGGYQLASIGVPSASPTAAQSQSDVYITQQPNGVSTTGLPAKLVPMPTATLPAKIQNPAGMQRTIHPAIGSAGARPLAAPVALPMSNAAVMTAPSLRDGGAQRVTLNEQPAIAGAAAPGKTTPLTGSSPARTATPVTVASAKLIPASAATLKVKAPGAPVRLTSTGTVNARISPARLVASAPNADTTRPSVFYHPLAATPVLPGKVAPTRAATPIKLARVPSAVLPPSPAVISLVGPYIVQKEQTLKQIAFALSTPPETLSKMNQGISPDRPLPRGTHLVVPKSEARIYLDNVPMVGAPSPYIEEGISMVPFRKLVESKGGSVEWIAKVRAVNAWADNTYIGLKIGDHLARINSEVYQLTIAPSIRQSRTMVPIRFLMAALKLRLDYNPVSGTYSLISMSGK